MVYSPVEGVTAERSGDRVFVLDPQGRVLTTLNPVGALVWEALPASVEDVVDRLRDEFPGVDGSVLEADVRRFFDSLSTAGLAVRRDAEG